MLYFEHETLVDNPSSIVNYSRPSEILSRGLRWNIPRWGTQETIWIRFCAIYRSYTKSSYYLILRSHPTCASGRHFHTSNVDGLWRSSSIIIGIPVASAWRLYFRRFRGFEYWRRRWRAYGECSPRPAEWEPNEKEKQYFFCLRGAYMPFSFRCGIDCDINIYQLSFVSHSTVLNSVWQRKSVLTGVPIGVSTSAYMPLLSFQIEQVRPYIG